MIAFDNPGEFYAETINASKHPKWTMNINEPSKKLAFFGECLFQTADRSQSLVGIWCVHSYLLIICGSGGLFTEIS